MQQASSTSTSAETGRRAWAAALVLRRPNTLFSRFALAYERLRALPRGVRRQLRRKMGVTAVGAALILAMAGSSLLVPSVHAAAINVDDGQVAYADDGFCSLPEAIISANDDAAPFASPGECEDGNGPDSILLPANSTFTLTAPFVVYVYTGLPEIDSEMTIEGNGSTVERDPGDADTFRLLAVTASGDLTINDLILQGGSFFGNGGAMYNRGTLNINNSTVSENYGGIGGGVYNDTGILNISDSTFSDNASGCCGGAINNGFGNITITNSTIRNNSAGYAGGIENDGELTIINSTISGNVTADEGGGVYNDIGNLTLTNSTVTDNTAGTFGGGVVQSTGGFSTTLNRSLISGNHAPVAREASYLYGTMTADNFNVFGYDNDAGVSGFAPGASDIVPGAGVMVADILETTLAGNGGPTETHALVTGSPAIDRAPSADCVAPSPTDGVDQRHYGRNVNVPGVGSDTTDLCDVGAFEYGASPMGPVEDVIFMSTRTAGTTGDGLDFGPEDIIQWDGSAWSPWFDGSAAGLMPFNAKHNINAFWIPDPGGESFVFSFGQNRRHVPGLAAPVDGMDLLLWDGSSFSVYFDGQDVGLTNLTGEKIDGLHILDGSESPINGGACLAYLLISTQGPGKVPNYSGGQLRFGGEDVVGFCATALGETTTGLWHLVLDGSAEGMPRNSTDSISFSNDGQTMYLTTQGAFNVDSAVGGHSMVYRYDFAGGLFSGPFFVAADEGLDEKVNGLQVEGELP